MTDQQHPITPLSELVTSLRNSAPHGIRDAGVNRETWLIHNAYALGADQELQACINFVYDNELCDPDFHNNLRAARRPKPPSLKEQALHAADLLFDHAEIGECAFAQATIRRALEALPND